MLHTYSKYNVKDVNLAMKNDKCFPVFNLFHKGLKWLTQRVHLENNCVHVTNFYYTYS